MSRPFKKVLEEYNKIKNRAGLEHVTEIHKLLKKGDRDGLNRYLKKVKDNKLVESAQRLAKYI